MRRWIAFNAVGTIGFALQLLVLAGLMRRGFHYLAATVMAVEAAILQNFVWHERWTWRDRKAGAARAERLWRFHLLNGVVSVLGNLALMRLLVGELHVAPILANLVAVLICSTANFAVGDSLVWMKAGSKDPAYWSDLEPRTSDLEPRISALGPRT